MTAIPAAGQSVAGRYVLRDQIRDTSTGVVWRARDNHHDREVALTQVRLPDGLDADAQASLRTQIVSDVEAAAGVEHASALVVYGSVVHESELFVVNELIVGHTLGDLVDAHGPLESSRVARVGIELLDALAAFHSAGTVHGGVNPSSVLVAEQGPVKLADFGVASIANAGSPYQAPEGPASSGPTPAADVWAVGATLHFAASGNPFLGHSESDAVSGPLQGVLGALLADGPGLRPSAAEARGMLSDLVVGGMQPSTGWHPGPPPDLGTIPEPWFFPDQIAVDRVPPHPDDISDGAPTAYELSRNPKLGRKWQIVVMSSVVIVVLVALMITGGRLTRSNRAALRPTGPPPAAVPATWESYREPDTGYTIWHPPSWQVDVEGRDVVFADPVSGASLRIDHQPPPGPSTEAAMTELEKSFSPTHANYQRLQIAPTTFGGIPAAVWEYRYSDAGTTLHSADIGFEARGHGFAITFQTRDQDWQRLLPLFSSFKASFRAPPVP